MKFFLALHLTASSIAVGALASAKSLNSNSNTNTNTNRNLAKTVYLSKLMRHAKPTATEKETETKYDNGNVDIDLLVSPPQSNGRRRLDEDPYGIESEEAATSTSTFAPISTSKSTSASASTSNQIPLAIVDPKRRLGKDYVDISDYSLRFEKCQFIKTYTGFENPDYSNTGSVLVTRQFVVFRLCPTDTCGIDSGIGITTSRTRNKSSEDGDSDSGSDSCGGKNNLGEYVVDLHQYLEATVEYQRDQQKDMCVACSETCGNVESHNDDTCEWCEFECNKTNGETMKESGYLDATEFLGCQYMMDNPDNRSGALYAGPMCSDLGTKIKIGVFQDPACQEPLGGWDVEDYLPALPRDDERDPKNDDRIERFKLSHALLKKVYASDCMASCRDTDFEWACLEVCHDRGDNDDGGRDLEECYLDCERCRNDCGKSQNENQNENLPMCEDLYRAAAKCETPYSKSTTTEDDENKGFADPKYGTRYENQLAQEEMVCGFVESLKAGTYNEYGEIFVVTEDRFIGATNVSEVKEWQISVLAFFVLGTIGLAAYAAMLHSTKPPASSSTKGKPSSTKEGKTEYAEVSKSDPEEVSKYDPEEDEEKK